MDKNLAVIFLILGVVLFGICLIIIRENLPTREDTPKKEDLDNKNVEPLFKGKDKPRISPPVHSMLELMLKYPEEFVEERDYTFDRVYHTHCPSKVVFSYTDCSYEGWKGFGINNTSISEQEGEYLLQGVRFIIHTRKLKQYQVNKERRHKVDREIRKVIEEKQL